MSRNVLLIDDEGDIREVTQASLEIVAGWDVRTAPNGREGLQAAKEHQPDVILLDVMMPDLHGPEVFRRLQEDPDTKDIPVILLTAKTQPIDRDRFAELGVAGVLSKPFDPMMLADDVAGVLGWQR